MEKKRRLRLLSPCTQKNLEAKSEVCERYNVVFAWNLTALFFSVSLETEKMALAFHFSVGQVY